MTREDIDNHYLYWSNVEGIGEGLFKLSVGDDFREEEGIIFSGVNGIFLQNGDIYTISYINKENLYTFEEAMEKYPEFMI